MSSADDIGRRQARVLTLHAAGLNFAQIARQEAEENRAPVRSTEEVAADVREALRSRQDLGTDRGLQVALETERLDSVHRIMEAVLRSSQGGRCAACGRGGEPELAIKAAGTLLRLAERRAKLKGLDAERGAADAQPLSAIDEIKARRDRKMKELSGD